MRRKLSGWVLFAYFITAGSLILLFSPHPGLVPWIWVVGSIAILLMALLANLLRRSGRL